MSAIVDLAKKVGVGSYVLSSATLKRLRDGPERPTWTWKMELMMRMLQHACAADQPVEKTRTMMSSFVAAAPDWASINQAQIGGVLCDVLHTEPKVASDSDRGPAARADDKVRAVERTACSAQRAVSRRSRWCPIPGSLACC